MLTKTKPKKRIAKKRITKKSLSKSNLNGKGNAEKIFRATELLQEKKIDLSFLAV